MTIREGLSALAEPYKTQVFENVIADILDDSIYMEGAYTISGALSCAFLWVNSPQGYDYWKKYCEALEGMGL